MQGNACLSFENLQIKGQADFLESKNGICNRALATSFLEAQSMCSTFVQVYQEKDKALNYIVVV